MPTRRGFLGLVGAFGIKKFSDSSTEVEAAIVISAPAALTRPTLHNPIKIQINTTSDSPQLDNAKDYILVMPSSVKRGNLTVRGGRNVIIAGGYFSIGDGSDLACISIKNGATNRTVHVEGVLFDGRENGQSDAFQIGAPTTNVQIQRVRIDGLRGALALRHADGIQPSGGMQSLHIEGVTCRSHYNNFYFRRENSPLGGAMGIVTISRTNCGGYSSNPLGSPQKTLRAISLGTQPADSDCNSKGQCGPPNASSPTNCLLSGRVWLYEFYANAAETNQALGQFVYPHSGSGMCITCRAKVALDGKSVDWPGWRVNDPGAPGVYGVVRLGPPVSGDFCTADTVGLNYKQALS